MEDVMANNINTINVKISALREQRHKHLERAAQLRKEVKQAEQRGNYTDLDDLYNSIGSATMLADLAERQMRELERRKKKLILAF